MTAKALITSMRLRTLPLSTAGIMLGIMLAVRDNDVPWHVILFTVLTTISLQILSNMSNELGDYLSGTDGNGRQGPAYSMESGALTEDEMRSAIRILVLVCIIFGLAMIRSSFGTVFCIAGESLVVLGGLAIWAAMHYTLGKHPYGYMGLGDLFVFLFFGLVPVMGGYFVSAHTIDWLTVLPASAIGLFSVGVLNVNNMRDMESDAKTRVTVPLLIGLKRARIYHTILIVLGWLLMLAYTALAADGILPYIYVATLPLYVRHLVCIWKLTQDKLDPMLPMLVMSTFGLSLLAGLGVLI